MKQWESPAVEEVSFEETSHFPGYWGGPFGPKPGKKDDKREEPTVQEETLEADSLS